MKIKIRLIAIICCLQLTASGQSCGLCNETPTVLFYDVSIQVEKPSDTGIAMLQWKQLAWIGKHASAQLRELNKNCVRFAQNITIDAEGNEILVLEDAYSLNNLPPAGAVSKSGKYLFTGTIKKQGDAYFLQLDIQTSCSRKTIASTSVSFPSSSTDAEMRNVANQAASQLTPLIDKIKKFELDERKSDKSLSLFQTSWGEPIKITPAKKTLKAGESTPITIELKDCDGTPLEGREIVFTEDSFEGVKIYGTIGGTVSPAKLITDDHGIAKATFTLKSGATEAIINAHSPGKDVKGCESNFIGSATINIRKIFSGFIRYSFEQPQECEKNQETSSSVSLSRWNHSAEIEYEASFYIDEPGTFEFDGSADGKNKVPEVLEKGRYEKRENSYASIKIKGVNKPTEQIISGRQSGELKSGKIRFTLDETSPFVEMNLVFQFKGSKTFKQTDLPTATSAIDEEQIHSVAFLHIDGKLNYKKTIAANKVTHKFTYTRNETYECMQVIERMQLIVIEE